MKEYNDLFNINSKLEDYKKNNIKEVQIGGIGISPIIYDQSLNSSMICDAINIFSSVETQKIKQLIIRKK